MAASPDTRRLALPDAEATAALGQRLADVLRPGDAVLLSGPLGAGKSSLARAAIQAACPAVTEVPSPTFTLIQPYRTAAGWPLVHADLYRLAGPDELAELGWDEVLADGAVLVEWPERLGPLTPHPHLAITLALAGAASESRVAELATDGATWAQRLPNLLP